MQRNKILLASLLILIGVGAITISCEKEKTANLQRARISASRQKDGGDNDEDPVIRGKVKKNNLPISGALVETIDRDTKVRVGSAATNDLGEFTQHVAKGTYFFRVTIPGFSIPYVTDAVSVDKDTEVRITVT
jgi:hypothetical protein